MKSIPTSNRTVQTYAEAEHEEVVSWSVPSADYRGIIAIHSTALGPAVGGTRILNYQSDEAAMLDALRLSRAMSNILESAGSRTPAFQVANQLAERKLAAHDRG